MNFSLDKVWAIFTAVFLLFVNVLVVDAFVTGTWGAVNLQCQVIVAIIALVAFIADLKIVLEELINGNS
jgi:hypothetical protein